MNRILFAALTILILSCQQDDVKNTYTIRGLIGVDGIAYETNHFKVTLISDDQIIATTTDEEFVFDNLEEGRTYIIIPESSQYSGNGLSSLDIVLIEKYLEGLHVFDPFQKLAADVNTDHIISGEDAFLIKNCVLLPEKLEECFSWRFASEDYDGSGTGYVDQYTVTNLMSDLEVNFVPIKIGDVNNTIRP